MEYEWDDPALAGIGTNRSGHIHWGISIRAYIGSYLEQEYRTCVPRLTPSIEALEQGQVLVLGI